MATLTEVSVISRKIIRYGIYAIILVIVGKYSFNIGKSIYRQMFPPKPPPPSVTFGKLPLIPFPERQEYSNNFKLELPEGTLPKMPDQIEVYKMMEPQSNITSIEDAKSKANKMGFNPDGKQILETVPNVYIFKKDGVPASMTMNTITGLFSISYNLNEDNQILKGTPPSAENAIDQIRNLLRHSGYFNDELTKGVATHEYLKMESGKLISAISLSDAQLTKVNLFRKAYGKDANLVSVTPEMPQGNIWFIIAPGRRNQIIAGEYHFFPLDASKNATYPLITSEAALEILKTGKAFIANKETNQEGDIIIRKVYLGYYDSGQYSEYYQPVIVFEGDNNFYAYVPAITDEYYGKKEE